MNVLMYYECLTGGPLATQDRSQNRPWGTVGSSVGVLGRPSVAHMALLGRLWRVLGDLGAISVDLGSSLVDLGAILVNLDSNFVDLGLNLVPLMWAILWCFCFCDALSLKRVESFAEEPNLISTRNGPVQMRFDTFAHE